MNEARIQIYQKAAYQGDLKAQYWLGHALQFSDKQESFRLLSNLAEKGNISAMKALALCYTEYGGYGNDDDQNLYWNVKAAEAGDADAQARVGLIYNIRHDYEQSDKWYRLAAEHGNSQGYLGVAGYYERVLNELIFKQMPEKDNKCQELRQLEEQAYIDALNTANTDDDFGEACWRLGGFYSSSLFGEPDYDRSAYFYYLAYQSGNPYGMEWCQKIIDEHGVQIDFNDVEGWAKRKGLFG